MSWPGSTTRLRSVHVWCDVERCENIRAIIIIIYTVWNCSISVCSSVVLYYVRLCVCVCVCVCVCT